MAKRKKYSEEFKREAVNLIRQPHAVRCCAAVYLLLLSQARIKNPEITGVFKIQRSKLHLLYSYRIDDC